MSRAAAIGEDVRVAGFALAGVDVHAAEDADAARAAFDQLPPDVACLILTPAARGALTERLAQRPSLLWVEVPA
ncbi:MAG TPA: V-type ATP synthase subunit F [Solirubrobacteraceae bacterium]|nr:V-type ATP synthase subunit F [Solirubrobacteraceae bacterium]